MSSKIFLPLVAFFVPIHGILIMMMALILADTASGIWRSKKLGQPITSRGLSAIVSKTFLYCGSIVLVYVVDYNLMNEIMSFFFSVEYLITKVLAMIFSFVELISINENYKDVKKCDIWSTFKDLTRRAKKVKEEVQDLGIDRLRR